MQASYNEDEALQGFIASTTNQQLNQRINQIFSGLICVLHVTAASGTGGLRPRLQGEVPGISPLSLYPLNAPPTFVTATGIFVYNWFPGATTGGTDVNVIQAVSLRLPFVWSILIEVGDASAYTYDVSVVKLAGGR